MKDRTVCVMVHVGLLVIAIAYMSLFRVFGFSPLLVEYLLSYLMVAFGISIMIEVVMLMNKK